MTRDTERPEIAIVGGGICGLTTALALEQRGFRPIVYEAATEYRPVGAGILLQTNALLVFDRLGIVDRIKTDGMALEDARIKSQSGRVLQRFGLDSAERDAFGHGFVAIHRADLQRILLDELDTTVQTDMACRTVVGTDNPTVQFKDGTRIQPDILIGADGIRSAVREAVVPGVKLQTLDSVVYRALVRIGLSEQYHATGFEVWGSGNYTGGAPIDSDRFYWFATAPERKASDSTDLTTMLQEHFSGFADPIPSIVESLDTASVMVTELEDVPKLDRWHRGSVVIAGDAAHGMLPFAGQGAAQALEDAITLADTIASRDTPTAAFESYEATRRPRADRIRSESRQLGKLGTMQSGIGCRARNLAFRLLPDTVFKHLRRRRIAETSLPKTGSIDHEVSI
jgi:2-polyprenyl-6-methoxyphenol hydroxylase-like FAD-dependent oxidoreductase